MKHIFCFLFILISGPCFADQDSLKKPEQAATLIEALNLEEQTIKLNGKTYGFSTQIVVLDKEKKAVGLKGLKKRQVVNFQVQHNDQSFRLDLPSLIPVKEIHILSDNEDKDRAH